MMVTNKARVEGSIAESTLIKEIAVFNSAYLADKAKNIEEIDGLNNSQNIKRLSVFESEVRPLGRPSRRFLDDKEYEAAHNYVIMNCPEVQDYLK